MKRKSSYPIVVVGFFFELRKAPHSTLKQAEIRRFLSFEPLAFFRRFSHSARVEAREVAW